jgi:hypothetical protein
VEKLLETLCNLLEGEIERQGSFLAVCNAQREAVSVRDLDAISARTSAIEILIRESIQAQTLRQEALKPIVRHFGLSPEQQTMSHLAAVTPEPWRSRLKDLQQRMQLTVEETRRAVRANAKVVRNSKRVNDCLIAALRNERQAPRTGYCSNGSEYAACTEQPVLVDRRG